MDDWVCVLVYLNSVRCESVRSEGVQWVIGGVCVCVLVYLNSVRCDSSIGVGSEV